jgi:hypothetical protein
MRTGTILAVVLFAVASLFFVYSMVITPRMDSGVPEQGYRRPIQDQPAHPDTQKKPPLVESNVPPASGKR